jgi:hypothetical protein
LVVLHVRGCTVHRSILHVNITHNHRLQRKLLDRCFTWEKAGRSREDGGQTGKSREVVVRRGRIERLGPDIPIKRKKNKKKKECLEVYICNSFPAVI